MREKREKPNFELSILANKKKKKQETRRNNSTNLTVLKLGFPKKMLEKLMILAFSSPLNCPLYISINISRELCNGMYDLSVSAQLFQSDRLYIVLVKP